jgi:hypothetical protein
MAVSRAKAEECATDIRTAIDDMEGVAEYLDQLSDEDVKGEDRESVSEELEAMCDQAQASVADALKIIKRFAS